MLRLLCLLIAMSAAAAAGELLPVWDMDRGFYNALGGGYNQFEAGGSRCSLHMDSAVYRGAGGKALRVEYRKGAEGYCGFWTHLFGEASPSRRYLDVSAYPFLSFHVRGARGGEEFMIQTADADWLKKDDSRPVGLVSQFLGGPITTNWQEVVIPAGQFLVDTTHMAGLTFNFTEPGEGVVYIDDICFKKSAGVSVPESAAVAPAAHTERSLARAMWVWETEALVGDEVKRGEFYDFCRGQGVTEIFLQLPYRFVRDENGTEVCEILQRDLLGALIAGCSRIGVRVHALDGYPEFALEAQHPKVLAQVRAIVDYNAGSDPDRRFYGIHLDNEPHQILGYDGPGRDDILRQFFALNRKVMDLLAEDEGGLVYGIDIPNWFDELDPPCLLSFEGKTQDPARHLIDICDNVGIMDYRSFAHGVDGMIHHALGEIEHADRAGKKVYIGVETFRYPPTPVSFLYGLPEADWRVMTWKNPILLSSAVAAFRVRTMSDGRTRYFGLAHPIPLEDRDALNAALKKLYGRFGAAPDAAEGMEGEAAAMIRRHPEYAGFEPFVLRDGEGGLAAAGFTATEYMLDKITFDGKTKAEMEKVLAEVAEYFYGSPSFLGFAVHYYTTWKAME